ncbi:MoaD/ThiS family protein [Chloroflexota bacterium]
MNIEVLFFGQLRELAGTDKRTAVIEDSARLLDLIEQLDEEYGKNFHNQVDNIKGLRILINGREYGLLGGMEAPLNDGDTVVFLPPVFGG